MKSGSNISMCYSSMQANTICFLIFCWFALPFALSAQERPNELVSTHNESVLVKNATADNGKNNLPHVNMFQEWASHGIIYRVITVLLSAVSGAVLLAVFWILYPYTIAPINMLTNSMAEIILNRFLFAIFGGIAGFFIPYLCYFAFLSEAARARDQVSDSESSASPTSNRSSQEKGSIASSANAKNDARADAVVVPNKPEIFNWGGGDVKIENPVSNGHASLASSTPTPMNQRGLSSSDPTINAATLSIKIAELQGDLAVVNSKIESERKRWQVANTIINALTNNKTMPVVRNSPDHVRMYESQVVMKQVEAGAPALKEEKSRLEAMIKSLQDSPPAPTAIPKTE